MLIIDDDINNALQQQYNAARSCIKIIAYSMSSPKKGTSLLFLQTWRALEMAIKRGIDTSIIFEMWHESNPQSAEQLRCAAYLKSLGANVRFAKKGVTMHSKTWFFDNKLLIIGSHNSTEAGLCRTKNLSVTTSSPDDTEAYRAYFMNEWNKLALSN